jgi:hypothetical protein
MTTVKCRLDSSSLCRVIDKSNLIKNKNTSTDLRRHTLEYVIRSSTEHATWYSQDLAWLQRPTIEKQNMISKPTDRRRGCATKRGCNQSDCNIWNYWWLQWWVQKKLVYLKIESLLLKVDLWIFSTCWLIHIERWHVKRTVLGSQPKYVKFEPWSCFVVSPSYRARTLHLYTCCDFNTR